jgi:YesN/AraC family two-component response regulator
MSMMLSGVYQMKIPLLLLIDLREDKRSPHVCVELTSCCQIVLLDNQHHLSGRMSSDVPDVIIFEFCCPELRCLRLLEQTKNEYPSIPILMVTEYHDEALAIWALRARVWDYLIKPVVSEDLYKTVMQLTDLCARKTGTDNARAIVHPQQYQWNTLNGQHNWTGKGTTLNVIQYVENHYHEKIYISVMAKKCLISAYQFSRVFRRENGVTFRTFLVNYRLEKALELLNESRLSVGDISFAVGFFDHSYFTRMFKKRVGVSPSEYRLRQQ